MAPILNRCSVFRMDRRELSRSAQDLRQKTFGPGVDVNNHKNCCRNARCKLTYKFLKRFDGCGRCANYDHVTFSHNWARSILESSVSFSARAVSGTFTVMSVPFPKAD